MNKEFIPYEIALVLKELGFNEECFGYFHSIYEKNLIIYPIKGCVNSALLEQEISAPLYQQAFRWFREKYDLLGYINDESSIEDNPNIYKKWMYIIQELPIVLHDDLSNNKLYKTYEEAELECLKKLIEIIKNK